jgi:hypothetical protein
MSKSIAKFGFILMDYLTGGIAWSLFYVFRKTKIEQQAFDVDIKDVFFIALQRYKKHKLWTSNLQLIKGVEAKGYKYS